MIKTLIEQLEKKGITNAKEVIEELERGGAITDYDASKYLARETVLVLASKNATPTYRIIEEVAYEYRISYGTLHYLVRA